MRLRGRHAALTRDLGLQQRHPPRQRGQFSPPGLRRGGAPALFVPVLVQTHGTYSIALSHKRGMTSCRPHPPDVAFHRPAASCYLVDVFADLEMDSRLVIVDDDLLTREVLSLLAEDAGYAVEVYDSGEAALEAMADAGHAPGVILTDLQMPGVRGDSLASLLRTACGSDTRLLAMSGSAEDKRETQGYDGFLMKPFTIIELQEALATARRQEACSQSSLPEPVNRSVYEALRNSLGEEKLQELYVLCLDDVVSRIGTMRMAQARGDVQAYHRAAHAIKGGCGMIGASELAALASAMETDDLPAAENEGPIQDFLAACARLRRMLDAQIT